MAQITDLPAELLLQIIGYLSDSVRPLSSLGRCSRSMHWLTFDQLFSNAFKRRSLWIPPRDVFMGLVFYAIRHDSQNIARWLCHHELSTELNGLVLSIMAIPVTYLHLSIIGDAPRVASQLVKYGTDVWEGGGDYPDIVPLYLAIANPQGTQNLDAALRIACSYAFPRISEYLLSRGADPNSLSRFGLAAIHLAVRKRLPWRDFALLSGLFGHLTFNYNEEKHWGSMLSKTTSLLLRFGADTNLRSATSRVHSCGQNCWCSPDCEHQGQAVLHFACGGGQKHVVSLLLEHGADPKTPDEDGYLPLFSALCQDHRDVALQLLENDVDPENPIIIISHQSTALHVACRFASVEVVSLLLKRGADANATDRFGQTPLHELLGQRSRDLEDRILEILEHLGTYGEVSEKEIRVDMSARKMITANPFASVRKFFDSADNDHPASDCLQIPPPNLSVPLGAPSPTFKRVSRQQGTQPDIDNRESFPLLNKLPNDQDGIKQAPMLDSVWLDKNKTEKLKSRPSPPANHERGSRGPGNQKGATGSPYARGDGEKPSPAVRSAEESPASDSARFWSALSPSQQQSNHQKKEDVPDGISHRKKRGNKWKRLDLS